MLNFLRINLTRTFVTLQGPQFFRATPTLFAEPLKKKRRIDPAIIKAREERRKKRLEKMIRRLEKGAKQLKPIDECEIPLEIQTDKNKYTRTQPPLNQHIENERIDLLKSWSAYKRQRHISDIKMCDRLIMSQQLALEQLRIESEDLYKAAVQIDENLIPFKSKGPLETPPIEDFNIPDGEYTDISKNWDAQ